MFVQPWNFSLSFSFSRFPPQNLEDNSRRKNSSNGMARHFCQQNRVVHPPLEDADKNLFETREFFFLIKIYKNFETNNNGVTVIHGIYRSYTWRYFYPRFYLRVPRFETRSVPPLRFRSTRCLCPKRARITNDWTKRCSRDEHLLFELAAALNTALYRLET